MAEKSFDDALRDLETGPTADAGEDGAPRGDAADPSSHPSVAALRGRFGDSILHNTVMAGDEHVVYIAPERALEILDWLRADPTMGYDYLADLTAVDYGGGRPLEVVYQLWSIEHRRALRVKVALPLDALEVDSVYDLWRTSDWLEREVYDMFGIHFRGHPDLRRILMPEKYAEGHPLRKDFPLRGRFTRAEQTRRALEMAVEDYYIPDELAMVAEADEDVTSGGAAAVGHSTEPGAPSPSPRPGKAENWAIGTSGSAAGGAPAPGEVST